MPIDICFCRTIIVMQYLKAGRNKAIGKIFIFQAEIAHFSQIGVAHLQHARRVPHKPPGLLLTCLFVQLHYQVPHGRFDATNVRFKIQTSS